MLLFPLRIACSDTVRSSANFGDYLSVQTSYLYIITGIVASDNQEMSELLSETSFLRGMGMFLDFTARQSRDHLYLLSWLVISSDKYQSSPGLKYVFSPSFSASQVYRLFCRCIIGKSAKMTFLQKSASRSSLGNKLNG
jgi:hypothetical protein